jgi:hypothetical protein
MRGFLCLLLNSARVLTPISRHNFPPNTLQISWTVFCSSRGIEGGEFFCLLFRSEGNLTPIIRHQLHHTPKGIKSLLFFEECRNQKNTTWVTCT